MMVAQPTRYHLIISPRASTELDDIYHHIHLDSPQNAPSMIRAIVLAIDGLAEFPHRFRVASQIRSRRGETRVMPVWPYLLYYRIMEPQQAVRVISIRHGARRQPQRLD
jgi:plasmid stabilization system protein ParE